MKETVDSLRITIEDRMRRTELTEVNERLPTRQSLLSRLKDWNDQEGWKEFFDTYWQLIYNAAVKTGLTDSEAQDVVQETLIEVATRMPGFQYDPAIGSFKGWLLKLARWRIRDQFRKRPSQRALEHGAPYETEDAEQIVDDSLCSFEEMWNKEWENNILCAAIQRVKRKVDPKQYQLFDLSVFQQWTVIKIARVLKVNPGRVYLARHRIGGLIKKEVSYLKAQTS